MKLPPDAAVPSVVHAGLHRRLAQRVLDAHRGIDDSTLLAYVSGSVVEGDADARSEVEMGIVFGELPTRERLEAACGGAGGSPWSCTAVDPAGQPPAVSFTLDGVDVQLAYASHAMLQEQLDELLLRHSPDPRLHRLADALLKAEPLFGQRPLQALQARLAAYPAALALAVARHHAATPTPWREIAHLVHRDAPLRCRELQVQACCRLLGLLAALNHRYDASSRTLRLHAFAGSLDRSPPGLADRIESLLMAPPAAAMRALHALEGEVLALVDGRWPELDLSPLHAERARFSDA